MICNVSWCNKNQYAKGFCQSHLRKLNIYGFADWPFPNEINDALLADKLALCAKCKKVKNISKFNKSINNRIGVVPYCKECLKVPYRVILIKEGDKRCGTCLRLKPFKDFYPRKYKNSKSGLFHICISCSLEKASIRNKTEAGKKIWMRSNHKKRALKLNLPDTMPKNWWSLLLEFYNYQCCFPNCDKEINEKNPLTHDHVIPITWEGSSHSLENSQILCRSHNSAKRNHSDADYRDGLICSLDSLI